MPDDLLKNLFHHQAHDTLLATTELLRNRPSFPLLWESFFRHVHDLKAAALVSNLTTEAEQLHKLEDTLWQHRDKLIALQTAQAQMSHWFASDLQSRPPLPLRECLKHLAVRAQEQGKTLGKIIDVRLGLEGIRADEHLMPGCWAGLVHLVHNSLVHGVGNVGMMWINAYIENWQLVLVVEDDGSAHQESSKDTLLSGRGVGLNAIRQRMKTYKGQFSFEESRRGGTKAVLRFPIPSKKTGQAA